MGPNLVELQGFTPATLQFLAEERGVQRVYEGRYVMSGASALGLLARLRDTSDERFPGGKWATIQHLEAQIAQAIDEPQTDD